MSMKVAKSIGLLYKLNRFLPETILKTLNIRLFIHTYHKVYRYMTLNISKLFL